MRTVHQTEQTQYLQRPGGRIALDVSGDGPLVVCVPGMGDVRSAYRFLAPALVEAGYQVATMDLRGHGDSDATFDDYDDKATGEDVLALIAELGGPAVIVGNSMGAAAAVWAAAEQPDLVSGLVLIGPFVRAVPIAAAKRVAFRLALLKPWGPLAWRMFYRSLFPGQQPSDLSQQLGRIRASMARPAHWRAFVATSRVSHAPVEARLHEVAAPVLVVMGERDPDFPDPAAEAQLVAARLGGGVVVIPQSGHYPMAEYPDLVTPHIRAFLQGVTDRG